MMTFRKAIVCAAVLAAAAVVGVQAWGQASDNRATAVEAIENTHTAAEGESPAPPQRIGLGEAAILGVVEGLTEYLPVSSTGHLILTSHLMGLSGAQSIDAFEIVIQLGAILAVLGLYRRRVGQMAMGAVGRNAKGLRLGMLLLVSFLPAAVVGLALHSMIEEYLFGPAPVIWALAVGGVLMLVVEHLFWRRSKGRRRVSEVDQMAYWQAAVIGLAQCLAMWPGTSRSMITILAALVVGLDMVAAAEFSFLLALPTLGAATLYAGLKDWDALMQSAGIGGLVVGLVVSGVVAALAVKGFVRWLTGHGLAPFAVYRILLAVGLWLYLFH